jgi:hypothetical protein
MSTTPSTFAAGDEVFVPVRAITRDGCSGIVDCYWGSSEVVFDPDMLVGGCLRGVVEAPVYGPKANSERVRLIRFAHPVPANLTIEPLRANLRHAAPALARAA